MCGARAWVPGREDPVLSLLVSFDLKMSLFRVFLPWAFLRPSQRAERTSLIRRRVLGRVPRGGTHRITEFRVEMFVRVLLMSVAVASGSAFCVSPKPQLPARRSLPRRPRTMPPRCARIGGRCVDTRIVETKVGLHSNSRATRLRLLALAPRSLPHSFHVPTPPLDGLQEELRRKLQKTTVALEEANAAP